MVRISFQVLFILLSLVALFVVAYDYTCGHRFEEVMSLEYCPICALFHAASKVVLIAFALLLMGRMILFGISSTYVRNMPLSPTRTLFSLRAPPIADRGSVLQ